jgi:phage shock protein PspC (stress-responsive transcriptional regulator)
MEPKRLYRNTSDKVIAGVCSGLGDYFEIDPVMVRLIFVALTIAAGGGVLIYIILWIALPVKSILLRQPDDSSTMEKKDYHPEEPAPASDSTINPDPLRKKNRQKSRGTMIGGLVLITLGFLFLADEFIPHVNFGDLWPVILVVIGVGLLVNSTSHTKQNPKS